MSRLTASPAPATYTRRQGLTLGRLFSGPPAASTLAAPATSVLSSDASLHLIRRATFGVTSALLAEVTARGTAAWLDDQLHPNRINDPDVDRVLGWYPLVNSTAAQLSAIVDNEARRQASVQLVEMALVRQIWSKRQLLEIMVDFWSNHFNVHAPESSTSITKPLEDRTVIRVNALGRFEDLLLADARSPGMLGYLDQDKSKWSVPNENYGRELLELYTVTTDSGFSEADVRNSALILTGRTTDPAAATFYYRADWHYVGAVRILGWSSANTSAAGGLAASDGYLRYLARHPMTAQSVCRKLAIRFVSDEPSQSLVDDLAQTYLDNGTAIVPVLQALFDSAEFTAAVGQKTRRPQEDIVATVRALNISAPTAAGPAMSQLITQCRSLNQAPFGCIPVTGYADISSAWWSSSGTVNSNNLHRRIALGYPGGVVHPALSTFIAGPAMATMGDMIARLTTSLTGQTFRADHAAALLTYAGMTAATPYNQTAVNKWLPNLVEMVLNSPYHVLR